MNSRQRTYTYVSNGNKLTSIDEIWENGQWVNSSFRTDAYDLNGNTLSILYETWLDGKWTNKDEWLGFNDSRKPSFGLYVTDALGNEVGRIVNNEWLDNGEHIFMFSTASLSSGSYYMTLTSSQGRDTQAIKVIR